MKKIFFAALIISGLALSNSANAQLSVNINIGNQPAWGPVGYDYARYYYLPQYNVYYDVNLRRFMYMSGRRWVTASQLPAGFGRVNLYNTYKVVVNRSYAPYRDNRRDVINYGRYRDVYNQQMIRDSRDYKYYQSKFHPRHNEWRGNDRRDDDRRDHYRAYNRHNNERGPRR